MPTPEIVLIAAVAEKNRVIGRGMDLPWHIPEDLRRFKRLTTGHPLVMGSTTFLAIVHQFGKPLPNRRNIILSTHGLVEGYPEIETYRSGPEMLDALREEPVIYIGGGGTVYEQFLPQAHRLELTLVEGDHEGDTFFPPYEHLVGSVFQPIQEEAHPGFRFVTYERRSA